jgi:hypothetical protein
VADPVTISSLATAGGTLVLAVATFSSVRSANRSARVAELSLLAGLRPVLIPSREDDPTERVRFGDRQVLSVHGHGASVVRGEDTIYLALGLRNGGSGLAVIHGWRVEPRRGSPATGASPDDRPDLDDFHRQQIDLFIPAGDIGYWLGALRDPEAKDYKAVESMQGDEAGLQLDLLYGDHEGGQRTIVRFVLSRWPDDDPEKGKRAFAIRYWNVDRADPR